MNLNNNEDTTCINETIVTEDKSNEKKILIYTAISGHYEIPTDGFERKDGYEYILFSDNDINVVSWKALKVDFFNAEYLSSVKKARFLKTHPHALFKEDYDAVVYVDSNTSIDEKLYKYIDENINNYITFKQHNDRNCIYDEIMACYYSHKEEPGILLKLYNRYIKEGYPLNNGLFETNVIISHYKDPVVIKLMNLWWEEIIKNSHRDQLSLNYVIWKNNFNDIVTSVKTLDFPPKRHNSIQTIK